MHSSLPLVSGSLLASLELTLAVIKKSAANYSFGDALLLSRGALVLELAGTERGSQGVPLIEARLSEGDIHFSQGVQSQNRTETKAKLFPDRRGSPRSVILNALLLFSRV